ncbi:HAMP domain-containing histidine kinase [Clostridium sp. MSJ-11]|uniref:histidine kinase n=1 Tax=Clostridium mobile TaxID=2841512 RepID=A0ABS6EHP1_9CLOT|nr:HAMP domain-containing sensor histidine kinase [Clostridium mobile]MBU5484520.1 HAMP domain-containing histidine kinase [Clostridium mobile]
MDIKKRLIISNTITAIVPLIITIIFMYGSVFVSSKIFSNEPDYDGFKDGVAVRSELVNIRNDILKQNIEDIEGTKFQDDLSYRLSDLDGKFIIVKGHKIISSPKDMNKIDIEKTMEILRENLLEKRVVINNIHYMAEVIDLNLKGGTSGNIVLLAPIGEEINEFNKLVLIAIVVYIISFIVTNIIMSYLFSERIIKPINFLKEATTEISNGNLDCEIIEDGDREIRELCHGFEAMRVQLKDSIVMKMKYDDNRKVLISSISHDLKTPITSIKGYVEGILDGVANTPEKRENYLKTIYSKAEHIDHMIDDLLLYSKLDLKQIPFNFEKIDIVQYLNFCISESEPELIKDNIKISLKNELKISKYVMMDRERMRRVILNIIENSRKYMDKEQGEIKLNLRETNSSVIIEIRDNGAGIDNNDINKIFHRFYRADSARSGAKGSGLGLAIAKQIVEGHKGRIWAVGHENEGTSIMISLGKAMENKHG